MPCSFTRRQYVTFHLYTKNSTIESSIDNSLVTQVWSHLYIELNGLGSHLVDVAKDLLIIVTLAYDLLMVNCYSMSLIDL